TRAVLVLHGAAEGTGQLLAGAGEPAIIGTLAVRSPMTFVASGIGVEHDHAVIDVSIRHIHLARQFIDHEVRRGAQILSVVAALPFALMAYLQQEPALASELENLRILVAASGQPHLIASVDVDAMLELRPFVAGARSSPRRQQRAVRV